MNEIGILIYEYGRKKIIINCEVNSLAGVRELKGIKIDMKRGNMLDRKCLQNFS